jgi:hypothetical protein
MDTNDTATVLDETNTATVKITLNRETRERMFGIVRLA